MGMVTRMGEYSGSRPEYAHVDVHLPTNSDISVSPTDARGPLGVHRVSGRAVFTQGRAMLSTRGTAHRSPAPTNADIHCYRKKGIIENA